jgi:hypothetical protein
VFPGSFVFGMVAPLNLIHLNLAPSGKADVFFKNTNRSLSVGQVMVEINRIVIYFLEDFGLVGWLETLTKL